MEDVVWYTKPLLSEPVAILAFQGYAHKQRLLLYVALAQTVIVTIQLLTLFKPDQPITSVCQQQYDGTTICYCQR